MHELSLVRAVADTVIDHADGRTVRSVHLTIGHFRQVVPETMEFCWDLHTKDGPLDGSTLVIDHVPARVNCNACGVDTTLDTPVFRCAGCGGTDVRLVAGEEFLVNSIDIAEAAS